MKTVLLFVFAFCAVPVFCQNADSLAVVREVDSLRNVCSKLSYQQKFTEALQAVEAAENKTIQYFGENSAHYASCLHTHGTTFLMMDRCSDAEPLLLQACSIREKIYGKTHLDYAGSLMNLATTNRDMGRYEKAEQMFLDAITAYEKGGNSSHKNYAGCLNNMAGLYRKWGNYEKAEPLYLKALTIQAITSGKEGPDYAGSLVNLSNLYRSLGNDEKAKQLLLEAKDIFEVKLNNRTHPFYPNCLVGLGLTYNNLGDDEKAEMLYLEAKSVWEKLRGEESPVLVGVLLNLASLYKNKGDFEKAEEIYIRYSMICQNAWGKDSPQFALVLQHQGHLHGIKKNYEKAEPFYLESLAVREKTQGKSHPEFAGLMMALAYFYDEQFRYSDSDPLWTQASALQQTHLAKSVAFLSAHELSTYVKTFETHNKYLLSAATARVARDASVGSLPAVCFDQILFYKGFLLNAARHINALPTADTAAVNRNNLLKFYFRRLAKEYSKPIDKRDTTVVTDFEGKVNNLEKELARTVAGYAEAIRQVKWQEVQAALKKDEAAIEFVHFQVNFRKNTDSTMYAALLLRPGDIQPAFIPLFEEKSLDSLLQTSGERKQDYVASLYSLAERGAKPLGKPQKTLYDLLWKPLEKNLPPAPSKGGGDKPTIYFSPSGLLHRLNLAAIPINLDSVLGDRYNLIELGSTRQLVIPATIKPAANDAVLYGGIEYDSDSTAMSQANATLDSVSIASRGELRFSYTDSTLRVGTWNNLPFTDREVGSVEKTLKAAGFQTTTRRGYAATEEAFKSVGNSHGVTSSHPVTGSPRVLHLATHGFFFPDPETSEGFKTLPTLDEPVFKLSDHPMIRSGLLLAGANHAWQTGKPLREGMEDGILTAYEISQMNLSNTELVVLSACETGLGDIQGNEGVYGLQRAFKIAGAKYLIMSLWKVDDQATMKFMEVFYRKWLEGKLAIPEAFRATQADMRERWTGQPYLWAGFVLVE